MKVYILKSVFMDDDGVGIEGVFATEEGANKAKERVGDNPDNYGFIFFVDEYEVEE